MFRVEGDKREFILLDITDDPKSKFFVLAKEYYDDRAFNSAAKCFFDPIDGKEAETEALGTYGVWLMSQEEMVRYVDKFGVDDGLTTSILFTNTYGWWLRSRDVNDTLSKVVFRYD